MRKITKEARGLNREWLSHQTTSSQEEKEKKEQEEEKSAMEEEELYRINVLYISGIQLHL